jgi:proline iminopeptidase
MDDLHEIYVEESGNEEGVPVVYVHGGPGAGSYPKQRQLFDPQRYKIVLFDQRGCGKSTPHAELKNNNTAHLIADMEKIRHELGIKKWVVAGGSWGSTLSLAYAQAHPDRVLGIILRGIFLCSKRELDWLYRDGAGRFFPELWDKFKSEIPAPERDDLLQAYHKRLTGENELLRMKAAKTWSIWEACISTLLPSKSLVERFVEPFKAISIARIEADYFMNKGYLEEDQLLKNMPKIAHIPGYIIHGRYDMVCLLEQAYKLHSHWPLSELMVVQAAGHSASEPGIEVALIKASNGLLSRL